MSAVACGQGRTTDGQEAPRARETASVGQAARMAERQVVAQSVMLDSGSDLPDMPGERAAHGAGGAEKAGGTDVERHAAAAARDGKGIRVDGQHRILRVPHAWKG